MIDDNWYTRPAWQKVLIALAALGLVYVVIEMRSSPAHLSKWNGYQLIGAVHSPSTIVGQAVAQSGRGEPSADDIPYGNPLRAERTVMTQGYGVGSHAPAHIWGAIDLAIDGDGDGQADPEGTWNQPVYATHRGVVRLARGTWPAGNHLWVVGQQYKTGYAHLSSFVVEDGQVVERGQLIAYVGSTGQSSGPHLDYQVWKDGVNVNPLDYAPFD